jgi:hypothetical protein
MNKILFFLLILLSVSLEATDKIKIFILHSYSSEYPWTKQQHNSFISTIEQSNINFEFCVEYLDTKRIDFSQKYKNNFLQYLMMKYANRGPDIVYVTDDNALRFIYENYKKLFEDKVKPKVFFSGINNIAIDDILPKDIYRGVYEIKDIKANIELIRQFSPQTRDIYFIGDDSDTYISIKNDIESIRKEFKKFEFHYISDEYIDDLEKKLPTKAKSFVLLTTIGHLKDADSNTLTLKESIDRISKKNNLVIISMEDAYMYKGVLGGYVTSAKLQGSNAAELALEYIDNDSLKDIKSLINGGSEYIFDSKELTNARIFLSDYIGRKATFINKSEDVIEKNKTVLLNILTVVLIILFFSFLTTYAIFRKKCSQKSKRIIALNNIKSKLEAKNQFINNILSIDNVGYWKIDIKSDTLSVSQELFEIFNVSSNIYKNDSRTISYFIHVNDKKLFDEAMDEVKQTNKSKTIQHRIVTSDKVVLNVTHLIYTEYLKQTPVSMIGIIKIEK